MNGENPAKKKDITILDAILFLSLILICYFLINLAATLSFYFYNQYFLHLDNDALVDFNKSIQLNGYVITIQNLLLYFILLGIMRLLVKFKNQDLKKVCAITYLSNYRWGSLVLFYIFILIARFILGFLLHDWLSPESIKETMLFQVLIRGQGMVPFLTLVILIGPIFEELIFRGFLFYPVSKKLGTIPSIWIISIIFIFFHLHTYSGNIMAILLIIPQSFALTWIRAKWGSILPCIIFHIFCNLPICCLLNQIQSLPF